MSVTSGEVISRIVARTDLDGFAERVLDSFWERPDFQALHPPRDVVLALVRWNLDLVIRWLAEGRAPSEAELEVFRQQARDRAAEGFPADIVPANFRRGARFAWRALMEAAGEDERPALLESADLLFEYVDQVSRIFSEVYGAASATLAASADEAAARALLRRIAEDELPLAEDYQLAERLGFRLDRAARPFVVAIPGGPVADHVELAAQLRAEGMLAASEGRRVVGLAQAVAGADWPGALIPAEAIVARHRAALGAERGRVLEDLRAAVEVALTKGRSGEIALEDHLAELLLGRSPRIAGQVVRLVYGPLTEELARTLDALIAHGFERNSTAAELPVHRNTLRDRIARITELTGVDLGSAEGVALAWLAWLHRRGSTSRPRTAGIG
jgi:hypothetical protein